MFEKDLVRRAIAERLSGAIVQPLHDMTDLLVSDGSKVMFLREVLSDQPVGVLIQAALPRRVGVCEVEGGRELPRDLLVIGELSPVVAGDGLDRERLQLSESRLARLTPPCCARHEPSVSTSTCAQLKRRAPLCGRAR